MGDIVTSGILVLFGGLAMIVAGLVTLQRFRLYTRGLTGTGRVVDEARTSTGPGRHKHATMQAPVIEVIDATSGRPIRFRSSFSATATTVTIGATLPVRYLPGETDQAEIDAFLPMWFLPLGAATIGTILLAVWWGR